MTSSRKYESQIFFVPSFVLRRNKTGFGPVLKIAVRTGLSPTLNLLEVVKKMGEQLCHSNLHHYSLIKKMDYQNGM